MEAQERWPVRQQRGLRWGRSVWRVSLEGKIFQRENISGGRAGTAWGSSPGCFDGGKIVT